jgi:NAD(P)-dependent dehydrogenase (short-subunit alcohol dehydrogenase family)
MKLGIMPSIAKDDLETLDHATMLRSFSINAFGPFFLTQALLPNILAAPAPRRLCVISSRVGSITDNGSGRYFSYRASKTAVNSFFKNFSVELKDKEVIVSMLHPGFTKSNLDPDDVSLFHHL